MPCKPTLGNAPRAGSHISSLCTKVRHLSGTWSHAQTLSCHV